MMVKRYLDTGCGQWAVCSSPQSMVHSPQQRDVQLAVGSGQWAVGSGQFAVVHGPQQRDVRVAVGSLQFAVGSSPRSTVHGSGMLSWKFVFLLGTWYMVLCTLFLVNGPLVTDSSPSGEVGRGYATSAKILSIRLK
ncbi:MAG: hypothetical protein Q8M62_07055 [Algoriphagus sp.]|uniref:hypothetical protein n=1 Tax=Algoriphagus sp. TaxID=1872435 RepID=UPI002734CDDE|nr:hypothetical protein [Algoriphagus sp.]MDP3199567.1 hypothetical protein [Algoriphagus sp.]